MDSISENKFYDSLDESDLEESQSSLPPSKLHHIPINHNRVHDPDEDNIPDLSKVLPLYDGEISRNRFRQLIKPIRNRTVRKSKAIDEFLRNKERQKNSYLAMYYKKLDRSHNRFRQVAKDDGSSTTRAVCESLTPRTGVDLADVKESAEERFYSESESEEIFYDNFITMVKVDSLKAATTTSLPTKSSGGKVVSKKAVEANRSDTCLKNTRGTQIRLPLIKDSEEKDKLEMLKKRQNYGTKMSMKNRIKMEEINLLKKINNNNFHKSPVANK